ncbi:hypothetical protein [Microbacterium sp. BDGP8]|uniref:hypothetical protein n=1 Tax=Microbacterium sp. BDGP8 TaxID=3035531 RepID=UPI00249DE3DB|nr:hypothetical protein [Microbacterium sp. BDGP8]WHE37788.1 hypothetical protein P6897_16045 [Microbacterium sp. BDGP8]
MPIEWNRSAEKHYPIADAQYALRNKTLFLPGFDTAEDGEVVDLVIGPARDGQMLELFLHRRQPKIVYLFHVLHLRQKTIDRAQDIIDQRKGGTR